MTRKIAIYLEIEGDDADEAYSLLDDILDGGDVQDTVNNWASDRGFDIRVTSATVETPG